SSFFFSPPPTTMIYALSLHDALPIYALLARTASAEPSVIRIRIEGLRAEGLTDLRKDVLEICKEDVRKGAVVSVTERAVRIRRLDRKSTRLNSSHQIISYAVFCLKKK